MTNHVMTDDRAQVAAAKTDRVMEPCALVLFGASGDLAQRMVMPAIFRLARRGLLSPEFRLIGYARSKMTDDEFRARHLALALEFELGADILGTAISPSWDQIGKLGAVAVIRTGLNFFLSMEMKGERTVEKGNAALVPQSNKGDLHE